jgi:putative tryptophan/tyrosine transport system substrate-binding protein
MTKVTSGAQNLEPVLETGRKLGFTVEVINIDDPADLAKTLSPEVLAGFDALVFVAGCCDQRSHGRGHQDGRRVGASNKPTIFPSPDWVANGGFMSFGPDFSDAACHLISQLDRVSERRKAGRLAFNVPPNPILGSTSASPKHTGHRAVALSRRRCFSKCPLCARSGR